MRAVTEPGSPAARFLLRLSALRSSWAPGVECQGLVLRFEEVPAVSNGASGTFSGQIRRNPQSPEGWSLGSTKGGGHRRWHRGELLQKFRHSDRSHRRRKPDEATLDQRVRRRLRPALDPRDVVGGNGKR